MDYLKEVKNEIRKWIFEEYNVGTAVDIVVTSMPRDKYLVLIARGEGEEQVIEVEAKLCIKTIKEWDRREE
jgi:hypothetical protein